MSGELLRIVSEDDTLTIESSDPGWSVLDVGTADGLDGAAIALSDAMLLRMHAAIEEQLGLRPATGSPEDSAKAAHEAVTDGNYSVIPDPHPYGTEDSRRWQDEWVRLCEVADAALHGRWASDDLKIILLALERSEESITQIFPREVREGMACDDLSGRIRVRLDRIQGKAAT